VVYLVDLACGGPYAEADSLLDSAERERAASFRLPSRRRQFLICRLAVRTLLGDAMGVEPHHIPLRNGPHGKPEVALANNAGWHFNISHSGDLGLIALRVGAPVGVDIQRLPHEFPWRRLMPRICSGTELEEVLREAATLGDQAFAQRWAAREALLKAWGGVSPERAELHRDRGGRMRVTRACGGGLESPTIVCLDVRAGFVGAIATLASI
jgi:4'-phosphopantetheinyl transferase